jgi:hypothetical protein
MINLTGINKVKKLFLLLVFLAPINAHANYLSELLTQLVYPNRKLLEPPLDVPLPNSPTDNKLKYKFKIKYTGTYSVSLLFQPILEPSARKNDGWKSSVDGNVEFVNSKGILISKNYKFDISESSGGGNVVVFSSPSNIPKNQEIEMAITINGCDGQFFDRFQNLKLYMVRLSSGFWD